MREQLNIEARDVRVGDELYDARHYSGGAWLRVVDVRIVGTDVRIETTNWHTTKHVREGVVVMRDPEHDEKVTSAREDHNDEPEPI